MSKFALQHIPEVKGKIEFYFLKVDGGVQYSEFEIQLKAEGGYKSELVTMQVRMQEMAEMRNPMPASKCKKIGDNEYELKTKNLRCYLFHEDKRGRVIAMLAKKKPKSQNKDIKKFRRIKDQYLNQK